MSKANIQKKFKKIMGTHPTLVVLKRLLCLSKIKKLHSLCFYRYFPKTIPIIELIISIKI